MDLGFDEEYVVDTRKVGDKGNHFSGDVTEKIWHMHIVCFLHIGVDPRVGKQMLFLHPGAYK